MTILLKANRRTILRELEEFSIQDALYKRSSIYLCPECGKLVVPHSDPVRPRFKHKVENRDCSFSHGGAQTRQAED